MSKAVKCVSCNVVIDEMLSYIQNKLSVIDEDTLVRICSSSFTSEEIEKSKDLLFSSVPTEKTKIKRKNKGKEQRDLADMVSVFKSVEPDLFPIFVAKNLERLPPILFDHLDCTKLLKDLLRVQNELKEVKETFVTQAQLDKVKTEILRTQYDSLVPESACKINMKRGGWLLDSGPIGLPHVENSSLDECRIGDEGSSIIDNDSHRFRNIKRVDGEISDKRITATSERARGPRITGPGPAVVSSQTPAPPAPAPLPAPIQQQTLSAVTNNIDCLNKQGITERKIDFVTDDQPGLACRVEGEGWQRVLYRKRHMNYRYYGTAGIARDSQGKFKAAVKKVPIFITKVHEDTTEKDIADYVYEKTKENITLERIVFKYPKAYKAFKFFVMESKLSLFLNNKLWPEGIIFRKFVHFKMRNSNTNGVNTDTVIGPL
jgi:hypothetical protein